MRIGWHLVAAPVLRPLFPLRAFGTTMMTENMNPNVPAGHPAKVARVEAPATLRCKKLGATATIPVRGSAGAAGYDLSSAHDYIVPARGKELVKTDLAIAIPEGTYARVAPRSGLAWKHSIDVGAGVSAYINEHRSLLPCASCDCVEAFEGLLPPPALIKVIDYDYRGNVGVILFNLSDKDFEVKQGDRVAQLILERILTPEVEEVEDLDATERGAGGFGSTGVSKGL